MKAYLIGGDSREKYLAYRLERSGIEIIHPEQVDRLKDKKVDFIVLPTPVTMDRFTVKATEGQRKVTLKEVLEIAALSSTLLANKSIISPASWVSMALFIAPPSLRYYKRYFKKISYKEDNLR